MRTDLMTAKRQAVCADARGITAGRGRIRLGLAEAYGSSESTTSCWQASINAPAFVAQHTPMVHTDQRPLEAFLT